MEDSEGISLDRWDVSVGGNEEGSVWRDVSWEEMESGVRDEGTEIPSCTEITLGMGSWRVKVAAWRVEAAKGSRAW